MKKDESKILDFLYDTAVGRAVLMPVSSRAVSKVAGAFLSSPASRFLIDDFIKKNHIDMSEYEEREYTSFNDIFTRKIKPGKRPFSKNPEDLCSPCDALLSAYRIRDGLVLPIKQSDYSIYSLLGGNKELAHRYRNGTCVVLRLCVENYHRYAYLDNGRKGLNHFIPGKLHTVRPIALEKEPVFIQNCREYTTLFTENFGAVTQVEVGALLVGKIKNRHQRAVFRRGDEKGRFLYGGSTVVLLFEKGTVDLPKKYFSKTAVGIETPVKMGETIGKKHIKL